MILVRTVIELIKNKNYYVEQCSRFVGPFDRALQRTCNNNRLCELYEIVALANVLRCEIQSVHPYIDYRAEMKIMNTIHKPALVSVSNIRRMVIFCTNSENELVVRARPGCGGVWSPNHFVPLVSANRLNKVNTISEVVLSPEV
jgi:hypothetical protein